MRSTKQINRFAPLLGIIPFLMASPVFAQTVHPEVLGRIAKKCPAYHFYGQPFSFSEKLLSEQGAKSGIVRKDGNLLYRGIIETNQQFTLKKVVLAILGDPSQYVESGTHYYLSSLIQRKEVTFLRSENAKGEIDEAGYLDTVVPILQACHDKKPFTPEELMVVTSDLLDKKFNAYDADTLANTYVADGFSRQFRDFSQEVLYASYQPLISARYGSKTLIIKEDVANQTARSIDKEYWMMASSHHALGHVAQNDQQEAIFPGYILPQTVAGFIQRSSDIRNFAAGSNEATEWSVHKVVLGPKTAFAALIDTNQNWNPVLSEDDNYVYGMKAKVNPDPKTPIPSVKMDVLPLMGVITNCKTPVECKPIEDYVKAYPTASANPEKMAAAKKLITELHGESAQNPIHLVAKAMSQE